MATALNFDDIFSKMVNAARETLGQKWASVQDMTISSIKTLWQNIVDIEQMVLNGTITQEQSALKVGIQKDSFKILLLSEAGIALLAAEAVLNAVIRIIKDTVNTAIGFALL